MRGEGIVKRGKGYSFFVELPRDPVTGHLTITGHVCGRCAADDQRQADADLVSRTGNRRARRRGAR